MKYTLVIMKKGLFVLLASLYSFSSFASHGTGAEIWYEHDTLNTYTIHYRLYNQCMSIPPPATMTLYYRSNSLSIAPQSTTLTLNSTYNFNTCSANACNSPSSNFLGFEIGEYTASVTLPAVANDWYFYVYWLSRQVGSNLATNGNLYVDATLDNLTTPFNNSVEAFAPIDMVQFFNTQTTLNLPLIDSDGDSLDINFITPMSGSFNGVPMNLSFLPGHTVTNPFNSTPAPLLNAANGNLTLYGNNMGGYNTAFRIDEYRSGLLIGSTVRDYMFFYSSNTTNSAPSLSGINNTTNYITSVDICPSSSLSFTIHSSDPDVGDSTFIDDIYIPAGATFTTNTAQNQVGTFTWTPSLADVRAQPYIISFNVKDDSCLQQSYGYQVFVNNCNPDSVWAGDANADFTCDNYDVLNIGIANNTTGITRPLATTTWQAEWCANWGTTFINNIDFKHADCNGDGTINGTDVTAVNANYGLVHQKTNRVGQYKTLGLPDLYCDVNSVQANKGSTVSIPVMLGTIGSEMNDFYGVAATVELLNAQTSAPISISKNVSWIGNNTNSFDFEQNIAPNKSAFTFVRNDQQNLMNQQGQIGEISFPIDANSVIGSKVIIQFSDIKMIKNNGEEITDYNALSDTIEILAPTQINDFDHNNKVWVYPNPTLNKTNIKIQSTVSQHYKIKMLDLVGRVIQDNILDEQLNVGEHSIKLDMSNIANGQYILEILSDKGKKSIPIQKR
jgi:hypothetical protein